MKKYEKQAKDFCEAIKEIATNENALTTLENYLACHFGGWLEEYASTPDGLVCELKTFAKMK